MKIVHVIKGKANPNTMNGVNRVVHHLATEQLRQGFDVEVWGITATPKEVRHPHRYPLRLFRATKTRFALSEDLRERLCALPADRTVAHLHSVFLPELYAVSRVLKKRGIPWVLSPHGGYAAQSIKKNALAKFVYMTFFEKRLISRAARLHAIGASEVADLKHIAPKVEVVLIPNGQALEEVQFEPTACAAPAGRPVFGFCGRLAKDHKGLDLLIEGFSRYKGLGGKGELWLIGDGPDKRVLHHLAFQKGLKGTIRFLGGMFGNEKLAHLSRIDVFVHTSRWDGIPMSVLEAAALGKPLLVSHATNMAGYVLKYGNGIALARNTQKTICAAMREFCRILDTNQISEMGSHSIKLIAAELNWPCIAGVMVEKLYAKPRKT